MSEKTKKFIITMQLLSAGTLSLLSGCVSQSECKYPTFHAHKYVKNFNNGTSIVTYFVDEDLSRWGYYWNEDFIELTSDDVKFFNYLDSNDLFYGKDNWNYLFNKMKSSHDYIKYWYHDEYQRMVPHTTVDEKGNESTYYTWETVVDEGWTTNPNHSYNTGKIRLYHTKFYGYKVSIENGTISKKRSPYVDDIRDIINDYPYFTENCDEEVYVELELNPKDLPHIKPSDFDIYNHPDLSNPNLSSNNQVMKLLL